MKFDVILNGQLFEDVDIGEESVNTSQQDNSGDKQALDLSEAIHRFLLSYLTEGRNHED